MAKEQYTLKLETQNIGPLPSTNFNITFDASSPNIKFAIYAKNGSGKTMLSNLFSLTTKKDLPSYNTTKFITKGENGGSFLFKLSPSIEKDKNLTIDIVRNGITTVKNATDYIFHVFNSEYIKSNITPQKYAPNSKIEGYIIGKVNIDLTADENNLKELKKQQATVEDSIKKAYKTAIEELDKLKIDKKTKEYKEFTYESIFTLTSIPHSSFSDLQTQAIKLKQTPDNLNEIPVLPFVVNEVVFDAFELLGKKYLKSSLAEELRKDISVNFEFISKGIDLYEKNSNVCPFCKTAINAQSKKIIDAYLLYIQDEEAKAIRSIGSFKSVIEKEISRLQSVNSDFCYISKQFNDLKAYLPSHSKVELIEIETSDLINLLNNLIALLDDKAKDVSKEIHNTELSDSILKLYQTLQNNIENNEKKITKINATYSKINEEKLKLNRQLCIAKKYDLFDAIKSLLDEYNDYKEKISVLANHIRDEKSKIRKDRKTAVANDLKTYLQYFFGNKYTFDEKTFSIIFKSLNINDEIEDVLSDGEKSIIAFCYYLSSIHLLVETEDDYGKLFYVIDDPISSMDFSYVFCVSRLIDTFCKSTPSSKNPILVLTHNLEFMNILIKNKLINQKYLLSNGTISKLTKELISPYENHLIDILNIANGKTTPNHTTANSIRYILESIWKFIKPNLQTLEDFVLEEEVFKNNEYVYTIINDFSHGTIRLENSYTEEQIVEGCKCVISYIDEHFPGQTKLINT